MISRYSVLLFRPTFVGLFAWVLLGCDPEPSYAPLLTDSQVLAFGDSITYGTGAQPSQAYTEHLSGKTGWQIVNAGLPGELARDAKPRLLSTLEQHRPDAVILELGGNDFLSQRSESLVKADLQALIDVIEASGARTILMAVPRFSLIRARAGALKDSEIYAELAEENGIPLIEEALSKVLSQEEMRADPIHPNAEGYEALAESVYQGLLDLRLL